ncbi:unnamed protein product [Mytilus edulis]|uniref:Uncharacterized protein n=1 Tax=Mytilus edulis TaxID=6550 RepID=A0A8S3U4P5_MYTED|nr:unnamed protein product [Mytilus edulis]
MVLPDEEGSVGSVDRNEDQHFLALFQPYTRKDIITQAKQHELIEVSRMSKDRLLDKLQEQIREDRKSLGIKLSKERELNLLLIQGYMCLNHVYSKEVLETNKECCVNHKAAKIRAAQRRDIPADFCQQHPPDESPFRSRADKKGFPVTIRLSHTNLHGEHKMLFTPRQIEKITKLLQNGSSGKSTNQLKKNIQKKVDSYPYFSQRIQCEEDNETANNTTYQEPEHENWLPFDSKAECFMYIMMNSSTHHVGFNEENIPIWILKPSQILKLGLAHPNTAKKLKRSPEPSVEITHPSNGKRWTEEIPFTELKEDGTPVVTMPLNLFLDDTSTHKSKRWLPLHCVQMQLTGKMLQKEIKLKFE